MLLRSLSPGRALVVMLGVFLLALAVWLPPREPNAPLRVAVGMWTGSESLLLAREHEQLPDSRFQWVEVTWPSALSGTLDNGVADAAVMSLESVITLFASHEDVRVIGIVDESKGADAVLAQEKVHSLEELKGRRVGVDFRGPGQHLLSEVVAGHGMKMGDLEMVSILQPEMVGVLARGDVAAVVAAEPWMTRMLAEGAHVLEDSKSVKIPIYRVLVAKASALVRQRTALKELLRAHFATVPVLRAAETGVGMDAVLRRQELQREELIAIMARIHHPDLQENLMLMKSVGGKGLAAVILSLMRSGKEKVTWQETDISNLWLDSSILEEISP